MMEKSNKNQKQSNEEEKTQAYSNGNSPYKSSKDQAEWEWSFIDYGPIIGAFIGSSGTFNLAQQVEGVEIFEDLDKPVVVVDAQNVAMRHGKGERWSSKGVLAAANYWRLNGHRVVAFLPDYLADARKAEEQRRAKELLGKSGAAKAVDDVGLLKRLEAAGVVALTPGSDYDDSYCLAYAQSHGGYVLSNDKFRDAAPTLKDVVRDKVIRFAFLGDEFVPSPDAPFYRNLDYNLYRKLALGARLPARPSRRA